LRPAEPVMVRVLSQQHHSWYGEAALFLRMLRQFAPQSLDRVFGQIDITKAEIGWAASLARGGGPRRSAALRVRPASDRCARRYCPPPSRALPQTFDAQTEDLVPFE
jgi:hypothetical protein